MSLIHIHIHHITHSYCNVYLSSCLNICHIIHSSCYSLTILHHSSYHSLTILHHSPCHLFTFTILTVSFILEECIYSAQIDHDTFNVYIINYDGHKVNIYEVGCEIWNCVVGPQCHSPDV